jgi:hypothetical protein
VDDQRRIHDDGLGGARQQLSLTAPETGPYSAWNVPEGGALAGKSRLGVIGCGLIAQVMHLPYLQGLDDRSEVAALCDRSVR